MTTPSIRACLYARYSTDKQRETSIDDQLRAARERAAREGWIITATYADEGISGSTPMALRPGGKALLADTLARRYDVLIVEGLDRISREIGEAETIVKRIEHRGMRIVGTADGYDTEARGRKVMRIARGLVNELYLDDLREKTHRGQAGQLERGFCAGGRTYGYRTEQADGGRRLVIDEDEARHVRWVFEQVAAGRTARDVVYDLNRRGVPSARGSTWAVSAVCGSAAKGLGMLHNELYIGRVVWNRRQWIKDPETGKRRYVERPRDEWIVREQPELRIIDQPLWDRIHAPRAGGAQPGRGRVGKGAPARSLLAGMLRCHGCGGAVVAINAERYGCSTRKDRGPTVCSNDATVMRHVLETRLLSELRDELLTPSAMAEMQAAARQAVQQLTSPPDLSAHKARRQALEREIRNLVDAVATLGMTAGLAERLRAAEAERAELDAVLASTTMDPARLLADVTSRYRALVLDLLRVLTEDTDRARTREILASMIGEVIIGRGEDGETFAELDEPAERLIVSAVGGSLGVVAGAGYSSRRRIRLPSTLPRQRQGRLRGNAV